MKTAFRPAEKGIALLEVTALLLTLLSCTCSVWALIDMYNRQYAMNEILERNLQNNKLDALKIDSTLVGRLNRDGAERHLKETAKKVREEIIERFGPTQKFYIEAAYGGVESCSQSAWTERVVTEWSAGIDPIEQDLREEIKGRISQCDSMTHRQLLFLALGIKVDWRTTAFGSIWSRMGGKAEHRFLKVIVPRGAVG